MSSIVNNGFQTISPIDGSVLLERTFANDLEINKILDAGKKAQKGWKATSLSERKNLCQKALEYFMNNADEIGEEISKQMGRPIRYTPSEITKGFYERVKYMIGIADEALTDLEPVVNGPGAQNFRRYIKKEPLGTVLVLAPWNYPYLTSVNVIIPALLAGNTVLLKHATQTPLCAERYAKAFEYADLPKGVFQFAHLSHDQVAKVITDNRIDYVGFTGSVAGGRAVQKALSQRFIGAGLELGGKDPAYVRADANIENAVANLVDGSFFNSGQSCCGIERIYVQHSAFDKFVEGFIAETKNYVLGSPLHPATTLGPMVKASAAEYAAQQVKQAVSMGAKSLIDSQLFMGHQEGTAYMAPHVLIDVNHEMDVMKEETFAPVVGIMSVKDDQEAIQLMNDSQYGLTASVWTENLDMAIQIGDQIETGTLFLNRCDYLDPSLSWTGVKNSGRGCTLSSLGFDSLTRPKSYHLKIKI